MNDLQRVTRSVSKYFARHGIYPTVNEVATAITITVGRVVEVVESTDTLTLTWTGPKPARVSSMIVEPSDGQD